MSKPTNWERCSEALRQRQEGKSYAEIAEAMSVSRERARQMATAAQRREKAFLERDARPLELLSARTRNCLLTEKGQPTLDEIRHWRQSGLLQLIPGIGKKSLQEVCAWLDDLQSQEAHNTAVTNTPEKQMQQPAQWYTATPEEAEAIRLAAYKAAWQELQPLQDEHSNGPALTVACIRAFAAARAEADKERAKLAARNVEKSHIAPPIEITEIVCSALASMDEEPNAGTITTSLNGLRIAAIIQASKAIEATETLYSALDSNREIFGIYMAKDAAYFARGIGGKFHA